MCKGSGGVNTGGRVDIGSSLLGDIDRDGPQPAQTGKLRGRQLRLTKPSRPLQSGSRSESRSEQSQRSRPVAPALSKRQLERQDTAQRSVRRATSALMRELAKPQSEIKPERVASRLAVLDAAASTYTKAFPNANHEDKLRDWLQRAIRSQGPRAGHVAAMARQFAGKAIATRAKEFDELARGPRFFNFGRLSIEPEQLKNEPMFKRQELTARLMEETANGLLNPIQVPDEVPPIVNQVPNVDHRSGQRHLRRLVDSETLKLRLGTGGRKKEVRTTFFGLYTINKGFQGMLDGLDRYQRKLTATVIQGSTPSRWRQAAELKGLLDELDDKVDAYALKHPERSRVTQELKTQIANERSVIDAVLGHGSGFTRQIDGQTITNRDSNGADQPAPQTMTWTNTTALMAMKAATAGRISDNEVPLVGGQGFASGAMSSVDLIKYRDGSHKVFKADKLMEGNFSGFQLDDAGVDLSNPRTGARSVATDIVARHLGMQGLVPRTEFAEHGGRIGTVSELAPGLSAAGHRYQFVHPDQSQFALHNKEELSHAGVSRQTNAFVRQGGKIIDKQELAALRQLAQRNKPYLAQLGIEQRGPDFYRLDQVVTDPIEKQRLAGLKQYQLQQAGFSKRDTAIVTEQKVVTELDMDDANVRRQLSDAQWLDAVTFQTDRHPGNIFIDLDENGGFRGLKLIDSDQSFGKYARGSALYYHQQPGRRPLRVGSQARGLPTISAEFKQRLDHVEVQALRRDLQGVLSRDEIDSTIDRIKHLKLHAAKLAEQGKVLTPQQWGTEIGAIPENPPLQYGSQIRSAAVRGKAVPPLLIARAEARLKAPQEL